MIDLIKKLTIEGGLTSYQAAKVVEIIKSEFEERFPKSVSSQLENVMSGQKFDSQLVFQEKIKEVKEQASEKIKDAGETASETLEDIKLEAKKIIDKLF